MGVHEDFTNRKNKCKVFLESYSPLLLVAEKYRSCLFGIYGTLTDIAQSTVLVSSTYNLKGNPQNTSGFRI